MEQRKQIIELFKQGTRKCDICRELDLNYWIVRNVLRTAGFKPKRHEKNMITQEQINRIKVLIQFNNGSANDYTNHEIADDLGMTVPQVMEAIRLIRYESRRKRTDN